jgi:hypothetical protein
MYICGTTNIEKKMYGINNIKFIKPLESVVKTHPLFPSFADF